MAITKFKTVKDYIASKPRDVQALLKQLQGAIRKAVPDAGAPSDAARLLRVLVDGDRNQWSDVDLLAVPACLLKAAQQWRHHLGGLLWPEEER